MIDRSTDNKHIITYDLYYDDYYNSIVPYTLEIKELYDLTVFEDFDKLFEKARKIIKDKHYDKWNDLPPTFTITHIDGKRIGI